MKTCRFCAEEIQDEAVVCRHCGKPGVSTEIEAMARRWGTMRKKKRDAEWAELSEADQRQLQGYLDLLSRENPPPAESAEKKGGYSAGQVGCLAILVLLLVGYCMNVGDQTPSTYPPATNAETTSSIPTSTPPQVDLELANIDCTASYGYATIKGSVKNTGDVAVNFVTVELRWLDGNGEVVDTGWTYAVGSEHLRPGESSTFEDSSTHQAVQGSHWRCEANLKDYRRVN